MRLMCAAIATLAGVAGVTLPAAAQSSITLFGQRYDVRRLDYAQQVLLPNLAFPQDPPIPFSESEGMHWLGNNKLVMSADDIADIAIGNPDNWIVEVDLLGAGSEVTGLALSRVLLAQDPATVGYDIDPVGVTVNTGTDGLAAGGNLVVANGDGFLFGFSLQSGTLGQLLEFPAGSGCLTSPGSCTLNMTASNVNTNDAAYIPGGLGRPAAFLVVNEDTAVLERWSPAGPFIASFPVAAVPGFTTAVSPAGLAYLTDSPRLPASLRRAEGVILSMSDDEVVPVLQAYDLAGTPIGTEVMTVDGTQLGAPRLPVEPGCVLAVESLAFDPATGRLFLSNQGALTTCNYLWVLTPACAADFNGVGGVTVQDIFDFLAAYFAGAPAADFNGVGGVTVQDIFDFLAAYFAGCS